MKILSIALIFLVLIGCKESSQQEQMESQDLQNGKSNSAVIAGDSAYFDYEKVKEQQAKSQLLKKEGLITNTQEIPAVKELIISKNIFKEDDDYVLDYTYPYLNEELNKDYKTFNEYMTGTYLNTEVTINEILEDNEIVCDTLGMNRYRDKRVIDYKVHYNQNDLISILIYKENYYSGMIHSTYMFETINYDTKNNELINFDNFFISGSEEMVFELINKTITDSMNTGEMYYDCWQMTMDDFMVYKNNFVLAGENLAFYLDDCIICPSHTGEYKVVIPTTELMHFIQRKNISLVL